MIDILYHDGCTYVTLEEFLFLNNDFTHKTLKYENDMQVYVIDIDRHQIVLPELGTFEWWISGFMLDLFLNRKIK